MKETIHPETELQAIDMSIEIWEEMVARGGGDEDAKSKVCEEKYGELYARCPLCELATEEGLLRCSRCPYAREFSRCVHSGYFEWAQGKVDCEVWARQFLGKLYYLKHKLEKEEPKLVYPKVEPIEWVDVTEECTFTNQFDKTGWHVLVEHGGNAIIRVGRTVVECCGVPSRFKIVQDKTDNHPGDIKIMRLSG